MIKKILEIVPPCLCLGTIVSLLLFTQTHAQNKCCNNFWVDVDSIYWKIKNSSEPTPLVIQGPPFAAAPPLLGTPNSSIVLGSKKIKTGWSSGARVGIGCWFDDSQCYGTELNYFCLPSESKQCSVHSNGSGSTSSSFLAIPYFNVVTSAEDSIAIASPVLSISGTAVLKVTNKMQGFEWNALTTISCPTFIALAGFRYWNFREYLTFATNSPFNPPHVADIYTTRDTFNTKNNFYGVQLGLAWKSDFNCLSITVKGKIAIGAMCERLIINGYLLTNDYNNFGTPVEYSGGYFALPTNSGKHKKTKFSVIPEFNFYAGYQPFDWMHINLGYTFMYASNVLRAGKQIDHAINPTQAVSYTGAVPPLLLGYPSPQACLKTNGLWVQGLDVGVEFCF